MGDSLEVVDEAAGSTPLLNVHHHLNLGAFWRGQAWMFQITYTADTCR